MKKRAKIITTIASLCLAVALMAFGVYAASTVTFSVTTKVSFQVKDVFVTIAGKAYKNSAANATGATEFEEQRFAGYQSWTLNSGVKVPNATVGGTEASQPTWTIANDVMQLDSVNKYVVYEVTIKNDEGHDIKIKATATPTYTNKNMTRDSFTAVADISATGKNTVTGFAATETGTVENVPAGTTITFTYVAHVTNLAADVDNFQVLFTYEIVQQTANFAQA